MRTVVAFIAVLLPMPLRLWMLRTFLRFDIHPSARIGQSIVLPRRLSMGPDSVIGSLTIVREIDELRLGASARLGSLNWVTGTPSSDTKSYRAEAATRSPRLVIEDHAAVTHRHLIDCTDTVSVGAYSTVAGWRSQLVTHAIDLRTNRQSCAPIRIGQHCFIGIGSIILKGTVIGDRCVLGAGAVASGDLSATDTLFGGVPAKPIGRTEGLYFSRETGEVGENA